MQNFAQIVWYIAIIAVVGVGSLIIAVWVTRSYSKRLRDRDDAGTPFTLQQLRQMHAEGKITSAEFEEMRAALIGHLKRDVEVDSGKAGPSLGRARRGESSANSEDLPK